jgi:hypothetical protein
MRNSSNKVEFFNVNMSGLKKLFICILSISLVASVVCFPSFARADIYRYIDEDGTLHFTNLPTTHRYKLFKRGRGTIKKSSGSTRYDRLIREISQKHGMNPALVKAVIKAESDFNPRAVSKKGARGLMQLMPNTMKDLKVHDPFQPRDNIDGGVRHLKKLFKRFDNSLPLSLAAYNAGATAVEKYDDIPPYQETQRYVKKVLNYYDRYRQEI